MRTPTVEPSETKELKKTVLTLVLVVLGMFAFCFAMVPMYNVLCKVTGLNGKTAGAESYDPSQPIDVSRWVTVEFVATNNAYLPWDFYPLVKKIRVHPGENTRLAFFARNNSGHNMTVQAIPSVAPGYAAKYLKKTECFCFTQQTFKAGEARDMPLLFHLDTELPREIKTVTLSYTMFDAANYRPTQAIPGHIQ